VAIVSVKEQWRGRRGSADEGFDHTYTRVFHVVVDSLTDSVRTVGDAIDPTTGLQIPRLYDSYAVGVEFDPLAMVKRIDPQQDEDDGYRWVVTVEYGPITFDPAKTGEPASGGGSGNKTEPTLRIPEIKYSTARYLKIAFQDANGDAYLNSADDAFDPPPEQHGVIQVVSYTRNQATFSGGGARLYIDKCNDDVWNGCAAYTVRVEDITAESVYEAGYGAYWKVTYVFHIKEETWALSILDQGYNQIDPADATKKIPISDKYAQPVSRQQLLNGSGAKLAVGGTPVFRAFEPFTAVSFAPLLITF
jgi:hypothetical protein